MSVSAFGHPCIHLITRSHADPEIRLQRKPFNHHTHTHIPMARVVSLKEIPTLRELYQRSAIATHHGAVGEKFPFSSALLDRVSV